MKLNSNNLHTDLNVDSEGLLIIHFLFSLTGFVFGIESIVDLIQHILNKFNTCNPFSMVSSPHIYISLYLALTQQNY